MNARIARSGAADAVAAAEVIARAFGREDEVLLVENLRNAGDLCLELGAWRDGRLVGHIAFQPLGVEGIRAASLAPVSILPEVQRQGLGSALIEAGIAQLRADGYDLLFVLGDTAYYQRFGFAVATAEGFSAPWSGPHFMALELSERAIAPHKGVRTLRYPAAFFDSAV